MRVVLSAKAQHDFEYWTKTGNKIILKKIGHLVEAIQDDPYSGIGKPEQLRHELSGKWSRRIDREHRLVYEIVDTNTIEILSIISLKGHY
ncbi:Txe/YoeB family addiction module toxin [Flavobacterium subsaxonicum]|uniref:Putative mRNA interferase YoeB n=1 Tax=Flavobacterium subsaxonicum WB 4.1-42 = DSM 21790 TaxID=1121898 RepID=A0A0A2MMH4_9FLAO|nr:Txe/YoeB family addiction module toxin [Flavobacterium subsaxonicum]KGO92766.1 toxin of toxin-antitoxin system [Flavobacterium subsaxonicum WB 4.1-42 = DSM 21790]